MNRLVQTLLLVITSYSAVCAQAISGKVVDAETNTPIANASIYFDGTKVGTISKSDGTFFLSVPQNKLPIVVSCIGYGSQTITNYSSRLPLNIALKIKAMDLGEVKISGKPLITKEEELQMFLKEFIGPDKNCIIANTGDIYFSYNKKQKALTANASKPLIIENKTLGYKITYFLAEFKKTPDSLRFNGNYFFSEDTAGLKSKTIKQIVNARTRAYKGSRMQFVRAMWAGNTKEEGFKVVDSASNPIKDSLLISADRGQKFYTYKKRLNIVYANVWSTLDQYKQLTRAEIQSNGYIEPWVVWFGDMASQRVAQLLPFDYRPPLSAKQRAELPHSNELPTNPLRRLIALHDSLQQKLPIEKLYVQTDKPNYTAGDTIWLKTYVFNGNDLTNLSKSGLVYLELVNDSSQIVHRSMLPLNQGIGAGQIVIDDKEITEGSYTLRAYTNLMRNFGNSYFFTKKLYVTSVAAKPWLVRVETTTSNTAEKQNVHAQLTFTNALNKLLILQALQIKAQDGNHTFSKIKTQTGLDGTVSINFDVPKKANLNNLSLAIVGSDEQHLSVPLVLDRPENLDLQFMPEGGNLLAGATGKVGFKVVGEDGFGKDLSGTVYDDRGAVVTTFSAAHKGMGIFIFTPQAGMHYTAKLSGSSKIYALPEVKTSGTAMKITETPDSLIVNINNTADVHGLYFLMAQSRNAIRRGQSMVITNVAEKRIAISKDIFQTGIARISLLNSLGQPLNERQVYIDHHDNLKINISYPKTFAARDSVPLSILVTDKDDIPVQGSFSLSVTDDEQLPLDSLKLNRMTTQLLLTSDLKGNIEEPDYYMVDQQKNREALDNLLLTQGWTGYTWPQAVNPDSVKVNWRAEPEFMVTGSVENFFGKRVEGSRISLLSKKPVFAKVTNTDAKGNFVLRDFPVADSLLYFVEATNKRGKNNGIGIVVNQPAPPTITTPATRYLPWYVNTDTLLHRSVSKTINQKLEEELLGGEHVLKDVVIKEKKSIPGSLNLNGTGEADQVLDEKDMNKSGDMTLEEVLTKSVKGFHDGAIFVGPVGHKRPTPAYLVGLGIVNLYIDGIPVPTAGIGLYQATKMYMSNLTAKEIKGIEIMNSIKFRIAYDPNVISKEVLNTNAPMFIEITTRAHTGPYHKNTPGTYVYRPLPFNISKQFYQPKYAVKIPLTQLKDYRTTIDWEPNIVTDKNGKATVSFYTSDRITGYTIVAEGTDMQGNIGSSIYKLKPHQTP